MHDICGGYVGDFSFHVKDKVLWLTVCDFAHILGLHDKGHSIDIDEKGEASLGSPFVKHFFKSNKTPCKEIKF